MIDCFSAHPAEALIVGYVVLSLVAIVAYTLGVRRASWESARRRDRLNRSRRDIW